MTKRFEKKCWYCGVRDMESKGNHFQCKACGATWNEVSEIGTPPTALQRDYGLSKKGRTRVVTASPSGSTQRRAARARAAKLKDRAPE